ncbi:MAG: metallophosphoesterase [Lachnospiraceae bacterium]|nr:metallophosphoesterase [Lachnospiraceae bacterium]
MHYAVGDVHGGYDQLMQVLDQIETKDENANIILLGDLVDRGKNTLGVLDWAMEHVSSDGKYRCIFGNHEERVVTWYYSWRKWNKLKKAREKGVDMGIPLGPEPMTHYDFYQVAKEHGILDVDALAPYIAFMESLPYHIRLELPCADGRVRIFHLVHAWYYPMFDDDSEEQRYANLWSRQQENTEAKPNEIVVHGHTPTVAPTYTNEKNRRLTDRPGYIVRRPGGIDIDCGLGFIDRLGDEVRLGALCLETGEEFYSTIL